LIGPGVANIDFSVVKIFPIHKGPFAETQALHFRAEFFNVLNHANFNNPNSTVTASIFGRILSAADPRIVQFGLKVVYGVRHSAPFRDSIPGTSHTNSISQ